MICVALLVVDVSGTRAISAYATVGAANAGASGASLSLFRVREWTAVPYWGGFTTT